MKTESAIRQWSRRNFLKTGSMATLAVAFGGCAKNPVTGDSQFMLISEDQEIALDQQASPQQLSNDYGMVQDSGLNQYISEVGSSLSKKSHRSHMPFSYRVVNANYINAYAFPGGTIAATRGILLELDNEAELAALMGHEIGHVNARHTASRMSNSKLIGLIAGAGGAALGALYGNEWGALAGGLGGFGAGLLLASYSRDDERQADSLGLEYMTRAAYNPQGMIGLMEMLNEQHRQEPSALQVMFATHPMSRERLETARKKSYGKYLGAKEYAIYKERFMDNTASLRRIGPAIKQFQETEMLLGQKKYERAHAKCASALKKAPNDYAGLMLMAKCHMAKGNVAAAESFAQQARDVYPTEAQAMQFNGLLKVQSGHYEKAFANFAAYQKQMPGNPYSNFYMGYSAEKMGDTRRAAQEFVAFLKQVKQGKQAQYAYSRLIQWGYIKGEIHPVADPIQTT